MSVIIISCLLAFLLVSAILKPFVYANFVCVCSSNGTKFVYAEQNSDADIIGVLRRDVCKAVLTWNETSTRWATIAYLHQTGHVRMDDKQHKRECYGDPQAKDVVPSSTQPRTTTTPPTTTTTTPSTTPTTRSTTTTTTTKTIWKPTTTTTRRPTTQSTNTTRRTTTPSTTTTRRPTTQSTNTTRRTTTPSTTTTRKTTTTRRPTSTTTTRRPTTPSTITTRRPTTPSTTTKTTTRRTITPATTTTTRETTTTITPTSTTTKRPFVKGNTKLCPAHAQKDVYRQHSILAQYGEFCYEIVQQNASWNYSKQYCEFRGGNLIRITDQAHQDYIYKFLQQQHIAQQVWIGLNDIEKEGKYVWSTGDPVTYTDYSMWHIFKLNHNIADCFVMQKKDGKWDDISCGLDHFTNLQNSHGNPWICQYLVSSTLPSIVDWMKDFMG